MGGNTSRMGSRAGGIAAFLLCPILASSACAAEELSPAFVAEHGAALVARVVYEGNKRTKPSAIEELTGDLVGKRLSEIDTEALRQNLLKSSIFSDVAFSATVEGDQAVLTLKVDEKWTFLPIPSGYFGSDGWSVGLDLVEFNFLGLRKTLVLGGSDSNLGLSGLIAYSDPRFLHSKTSFRVFADYGRAQKEAQYMDGSDYASFLETTADGGLSVQYPSEGKLQAEFDLTLRYSGVGSGDARSYGLYENSLVLIPTLVVNYDGQLNVGYRVAGTSGSASYTHAFQIRGLPAYDIIEANGELDLKVFLGGYLELGATGRYGTGAFQSLGSLTGQGFRTLPYEYSFSPKNAAAYANLALPLFKLGWSVMEMGPFYECGVYATGLEGETVDIFHGPGFLYRLYLRDVALPAIEIAAAYNVPARNLVLSVNIGVSL